MSALASVPAAMSSWTQVSTWKMVSHKKEGHTVAGRSACRRFSMAAWSPTVWGRNTRGTPPRVMVSPSFTGAEPVMGVPFTRVPPLESRS